MKKRAIISAAVQALNKYTILRAYLASNGRFELFWQGFRAIGQQIKSGLNIPLAACIALIIKNNTFIKFIIDDICKIVFILNYQQINR